MTTSDKKFRAQYQCMHITYKTHMDPQLWKDRFYPLHGEPKLISFVHESADDENPYDHTHICVEWIKHFDTTNCRVFDFQGIHPHLLKVQGLEHKKCIVTKYHWKAPKGPVTIELEDDKVKLCPLQVGCDKWMLEAEAWDIAAAAPSLKDACLALGVRPKTISEVEKVRATKKRKFTEPAEGVEVSRFKPLDWNRQKALVLRGPAGIGKTQWALAQFNKPIMIEDLDELRDVPPDCDGLVFDEVQFNLLAKAKKIALTDWEMDRTVRIRHTVARIPRHTPKIFTCNEHEHTFGEDSHESVLRRIQTMDVDSDMIVRTAE